MNKKNLSEKMKELNNNLNSLEHLLTYEKVWEFRDERLNRIDLTNIKAKGCIDCNGMYACGCYGGKVVHCRTCDCEECNPKEDFIIFTEEFGNKLIEEFNEMINELREKLLNLTIN